MKKDEDHDKNMDEDHGTDKDNNNALKILRTIIRIRIMPRTSTMTRIRTCRGRIKKTERIRTRTQLMAQKGCAVHHATVNDEFTRIMFYVHIAVHGMKCDLPEACVS